MASPFGDQRHRLARHSMATTPARGSPLARSPSTPYDVYRAQHSEGGPRLGSASRLSRQSTVFATPQSRQASSSAFASPSSPSTFGAAYRRNVGFGSPGAAAMRGSPRTSMASTRIDSGNMAYDGDESLDSRAQNVRSKPRTSSRFIRRKSVKEKLLDIPRDLYDKIIFSEWSDFSNPALGFPIGIAMHILSLLLLIVHPEGALHFSRNSSKLAKPNSLFTEQATSGLASRRRLQKESAWRWTAALLAFALLLAAIVNTVHLFTARRRYHLWLKPTTDVVQSENASFVDLPSDVEPTGDRTAHDRIIDALKSLLRRAWRVTWWTTKKILWQMRSIPYIGIVIRILFPVFSRLSSARSARASASGPQMHAIDMWEAPEVPLRIFTLYSPLHAAIYLANMNALPFFNLHPSGAASRISSLLVSATVMAIFSAQTMLLVHLYSSLVKDKSIVAGEVLNEYDRKFVMPRATPVCRDASTMTSQAEMIDPREWASNGASTGPDQLYTGQYTGEEPSKTSRNAQGFGRLSLFGNSGSQTRNRSPSQKSTSSSSAPSSRRKGRQTTGV